MRSADLIEKNINLLAEAFPNIVTEVKNNGGGGRTRKTVDFEKLRALLSAYISNENEVYQFTWPGKREAMASAYKPSKKTLRPLITDSVNWDYADNLYIEGDNLEVLKLLQESYLNRIKVIYIDPPYNTGNDFIYADNFTQSKQEYDTKTASLDEEGSRYFRNTTSNGRYHSDWCSMIYSRLLLARNLLRDDGAIFISIDDNEVDNLKKIASEVFGEDNFVATFPWRKRTAKSDVPFGISQDYEWIVCYAKSSLFRASIEGKERKYYESEDFPGRPWRIHDLTKQTTASERPNSYFTIVNPKNGAEYPANPNSTWRITKESIKEYLMQNRIVFPGDYPFLKIKKPVLRYWKDDDMKKAGDEFGRVSVSTKLPDFIGMSKDGTKEITNLFSGKIFSYPKPTELIKYLISICASDGDIVLDFFSGSASTAQAVIELNKEKNIELSYILVQLQEETDPTSEAFKAGYNNICELGRARIQKVLARIYNDKVPERVGFRAFTLAESNMKDIFYTPNSFTQGILFSLESNIKEDRTDMDLLFGCLLEWGLELSKPCTSQEISGVAIYMYDEDALIACFAEAIPEEVIYEIAKRQPLRAVFRDSSFADDAARVNVTEIFKLLSPDTQIKVL